MADTMKLPGIGPVKKTYVYIAGAGIAGFVLFAYWSRSKEDDTEISDYTEPDYVMDESEDEYENPGGSEEPVTEDHTLPPNTNAEWSVRAVDRMVDLGYEAIPMSVAIGMYLARQTVSKEQSEMLRAMLSQVGPPPQGAYEVKVSSTTPTPPPVKLIAPTGLSAHNIGSTSVGFLWNAVTGDRWYTLSISGKEYNTASTQYTVKGLKRNTLYTAKVRAVGMDKKPGPWSASRKFRTKK